jgi:hypothetical protein
LSEEYFDDVSIARLQARQYRLYSVVTGLLVAAIAILALYSIRLGPLVGPGVESSFGFALAIMFVSAAVIFHIVDRVYREFPWGRRVHPPSPAALTDRDVANFLFVVVLLGTLGAVAYILGSLITA